jgi:hypothetical protein
MFENLDNHNYKSKFYVYIFFHSNSDIWREFPTFLTQNIFTQIYLTNQQGCRTSVAAAVLDEKELFHNDDTADPDCCYIQPYWLPGIPLENRDQVPFPLYEILGPYQGYRVTKPRLPFASSKIASSPKLGSGSSSSQVTNHLSAGEALWKACEELTGCTWEP